MKNCELDKNIPNPNNPLLPDVPSLKWPVIFKGIECSRTDALRLMGNIFMGKDSVACWEWKGSFRRGYPQFFLKNRNVGAHQLMYCIYNDGYDSKLSVLHNCHNSECVNPQHLSVGVPKTLTRENLLQKFFGKVDTSGGELACWMWKGAKCQNGYGTMMFEKKLRSAHHLVFFLRHGEWPAYDPKHSVLAHLCGKKLCVNPGHLQLVPANRNIRHNVVAQRQARGDTHSSVTKPECVRRGAKNGRAKLSEIDVAIIRKTANKYDLKRGIFAILGRKFRIGEDIVGRIVKRDLWAELDESAVSEATALELDPSEFGRAKGALSPSATLSVKDVSRIRALIKLFPRLYGINKLICSIWPIRSTHLSRLKAGTTWADVKVEESDVNMLAPLSQYPKRQQLESIKAAIRQNGWDRLSESVLHNKGAD
jgi:hypothetical protein